MKTSIIGNVGILDLRNSTEKSIQQIKSIGNVGIAIVSTSTLPLLHQLPLGNLGMVIEIKEGYQLYTETLEINQAFLETLDPSLRALTADEVVIAYDVEAELLKEKIEDIEYCGDVSVPHHLYGAVQSVMTSGGGKMKTYDQDAEKPIHKKGVFKLTPSFLESLKKPTTLNVKGILQVDERVTEDQLVHVKELQVKGVIELREHMVAHLSPLISQSSSAQMTVIPDDYTVIDRALRMKEKQLQSWKQKKLYTEHPLYMNALKRDTIERSICNIHSSSFIVTSSESEDLLYEIVDTLDSEILAIDEPYLVVEKNELWDETAFLNLQEAVVVIVVNGGELTFAENVTADMIRERIDTIYHFGTLIAPKEIQLTIKQKLEINEGKLQSEKEEGTGNVGVLKL